MKSRWLHLLWILVPLAAVAEMTHHGWVQSRVPRERDWKDAEALVEAGHREGDLVVIEPWWASQGWVHLGRFVTVEQMSRADDRGYGRIWEVALPGHRNPQYEASGDLVSEQKAGRLRVRLWKFPDAPENIYDFVAALETDAVVSMVPEAGGPPEPCTFREHPATAMVPGRTVQSGKFRCDPRLPWNTVDREVIADLDNRPRLCIWAHPVAGKKVRIEFPGVPEAAVIEGHTGLKYEAARETIERPPIFVEIRAAGEVVGTAMQERGKGWTPFRFDLGQGGTGGRVSFDIWTADAGMGHFCFEAKLRDR